MHFESSTADAFEADIRSLSNQDNVRPPHTREGYEFTGKKSPENEEGGRHETKNIIIIRSMMIHDLDGQRFTPFPRKFFHVTKFKLLFVGGCFMVSWRMPFATFTSHFQVCCVFFLFFVGFFSVFFQRRFRCLLSSSQFVLVFLLMPRIVPDIYVCTASHNLIPTCWCNITRYLPSVARSHFPFEYFFYTTHYCSVLNQRMWKCLIAESESRAGNET